MPRSAIGGKREEKIEGQGGKERKKGEKRENRTTRTTLSFSLVARFRDAGTFSPRTRAFASDNASCGLPLIPPPRVSFAGTIVLVDLKE